MLFKKSQVIPLHVAGHIAIWSEIRISTINAGVGKYANRFTSNADISYITTTIL